jgi:soluble lytic murein transglycosylase
MLGRAQKLMQGKQTTRAEKEYNELVSKLGGADRDLARVGIGATQYTATQNAAAYRYLSALEVSAPEADAQRLYYMLEADRRLEKLDDMDALASKIGNLYPTSPWYLEAVVSAANRHLIDNDTNKYEPLYRACYTNFRKDSRAAMCHWKATWVHYLHRQSDAGDMLREQLRMFPSSEDASAALYFLGRLAQQSRDNASARAYFEEVDREYPNQYYATVARERLAEVRGVQPASSVADFLRTISFPQRARTRVFAPNPAAQSRIERAHLLVSAGLTDWAERELRFGAQTEDQPHLLAMELAALSGPDKPQQAIKYVKGLAPGYLFLPIDSAPFDFWRIAFPLPYRNDLERFSRDNKVDPFLMAALIRQESEFDKGAVSPANARGLTQIEPSTGRELNRRFKVTKYTTTKLFDPSVNLQFGSFYFKQMTNSLNGNTEAALAAYNAGLSRARAWLTWGDFREPAEFVETVPFTQTRGYIQAVVRNADAYRRIYTPVERASAQPVSAK